MKRKDHVFYSGPGVYCPHIHFGVIEWRKDTTGDPLFGVQIDHIGMASKLGQLVRVEALEPETSK